MRGRISLLGALAVAVATLAAPASAQAADSSANAKIAPTVEQVQRNIDDIVHKTPGARQINANTIDLNGALMILGISGSQQEIAAAGGVTPMFVCQTYYVCVYSDQDFSDNGNQLVFTVCNREWDLGLLNYPGGGRWNDRVSSITNRQSTGTTSHFYNYVGYWSRLKAVNAGSYLTNLANDQADDGSGMINDKIDGIHVCGSTPNPWTPNYPSGVITP